MSQCTRKQARGGGGGVASRGWGPFMAAATRAATLCSHHYVVVSCRAFTHRTAFPHCTQIRKYFPRRAHVTKCQEFRASSSDRALVVIRLLPAKNARVMLCFRPSCVNDPSSRLTFSALTLEKFLPLLDECIFKAAFSQPSCSSRVRVDAESTAIYSVFFSEPLGDYYMYLKVNLQPSKCGHPLCLP